AQASDTRSYGGEDKADPAVTEAPFAHATVYPKGAVLPEGFRVSDQLEQNSSDAQCLQDGTPCDIFVVPGAAGAAPTLIVQRTEPRYDSASVFARDASGVWQRSGTLNNMRCASVIAALREGKVARARPAYDDLEAAGIRLEMTPYRESGPDPCPAPSAAPPPPSKPSDAKAPARMGPAFGNPGPG
ncbi:MAG: hypothetical protein ACKVOL_10250, partial [Novosphingobium sp.]